MPVNERSRLLCALTNTRLHHYLVSQDQVPVCSSEGHFGDPGLEVRRVAATAGRDHSLTPLSRQPPTPSRTPSAPCVARVEHGVHVIIAKAAVAPLPYRCRQRGLELPSLAHLSPRPAAAEEP